MWRRHGSNFSVDSEAYDIARGLYDSKGTCKLTEHCKVKSVESNRAVTLVLVVVLRWFELDRVV